MRACVRVCGVREKTLGLQFKYQPTGASDRQFINSLWIMCTQFVRIERRACNLSLTNICGIYSNEVPPIEMQFIICLCKYYPLIRDLRIHMFITYTHVGLASPAMLRLCSCVRNHEILREYGLWARVIWLRGVLPSIQYVCVLAHSASPQTPFMPTAAASCARTNPPIHELWSNYAAVFHEYHWLGSVEERAWRCFRF